MMVSDDLFSVVPVYPTISDTPLVNKLANDK